MEIDYAAKAVLKRIRSDRTMIMRMNGRIGYPLSVAEGM